MFGVPLCCENICFWSGHGGSKEISIAGYYMMDCKRAFVDSSFGSRLGELAPFLLDQWLECAGREYGISNIRSRVDVNRFSALDDFIDILFSALDSLSKKSPESAMSFFGSYGFICGFVQGGLNVRWTDSFIVEYTTEFKDLLKLKTVLEILKHDRRLAKKVDIYYDYYLDSNGIRSDRTFTDNTAPVIEHSEGRGFGKGKYTDEFCAYFEKSVVEGFQSLHRKYNRMCCPDLTDYLDRREVRELLEVLT